MDISVEIIRGRPVRIARRNLRRVIRLAHRLAAMGWPRHAIRRACRLSPTGLARALRPGINGLWGHHAARIARELRGAA